MRLAFLPLDRLAARRKSTTSCAKACLVRRGACWLVRPPARNRRQLPAPTTRATYRGSANSLRSRRIYEIRPWRPRPAWPPSSHPAYVIPTSKRRLSSNSPRFESARVLMQRARRADACGRRCHERLQCPTAWVRLGMVSTTARPWANDRSTSRRSPSVPPARATCIYRAALAACAPAALMTASRGMLLSSRRSSTSCLRQAPPRHRRTIDALDAYPRFRRHPHRKTTCC